MSPAPHILTIDLEDWFHGLEPDPVKWAQLPRRADTATRSALRILECHAAQATFFVLGDVATHSPGLIREVSSAGHEIGTHGMRHQFVTAQTRDEFRRDLMESINLLQAITGRPVQSYRAPFFSITRQSWWALSVLEECGIRNDSSIFPARNPRYGIPDAPRLPHQVHPSLWEWPVSTLPTPLGNVPFGGGAYLRLLPWWFVACCTRLLEQRKEPVIFYLHPWELDVGQPRYASGSWLFRQTHYCSLAKTAMKVHRLLSERRYTSLADAIGSGRNGEATTKLADG